MTIFLTEGAEHREEWTKLLDTKFDLLNSIPETHREVEENQHKAVLWLLQHTEVWD